MLNLRSRRLQAGVILLACVLAASCYRDPRFKPTYPVTGKVLFEGAPPVGANIKLIPLLKEGEALDPFARPASSPDGIGADGSFSIMTYKYNDGCPPGEYALVVYWLPPGAQGPLEQVNKLPNRYSTVEGSPLKLTVGDKPVDLGTINLTK